MKIKLFCPLVLLLLPGWLMAQNVLTTTGGKVIMIGSQSVYFTNSTVPMVTTNALSAITATSATCGGNVTSDGGVAVTSRGVCWSTRPDPTISSGDFTTDGAGTGSFVSSLTFASNSPYYVRAYATNSSGTVYGNEVSLIRCGISLTVTHTSGAVAPETKTVTYGIVQTSLSGTSKCWITQNLGADNQAASVDDDTDAAAGWYWQFNRKQGFEVGPIPAWTINSISEASDWLPANDPCTLELGTSWRIPTYTEWLYADGVSGGNWSSSADAYNSVLMLHAAGILSTSSGGLGTSRSASGHYWSSKQNSSGFGWNLSFDISTSRMNSNNKAYGFSVRCLKD